MWTCPLPFDHLHINAFQLNSARPCTFETLENDHDLAVPRVPSSVHCRLTLKVLIVVFDTYRRTYPEGILYPIDNLFQALPFSTLIHFQMEANPLSVTVIATRPSIRVSQQSHSVSSTCGARFCPSHHLASVTGFSHSPSYFLPCISISALLTKSAWQDDARAVLGNWGQMGPSATRKHADHPCVRYISSAKCNITCRDLRIFCLPVPCQCLAISLVSSHKP